MGAKSGRTPVTSKAQLLARKIRERIQGEQVPDGTFFMTEAQVAQEYGASRTVTREALSRLQALSRRSVRLRFVMRSAKLFTFQFMTSNSPGRFASCRLTPRYQANCRSR